VGLDFYRRVVALQQKYAGTMRVRNDFQTNGVLLDEAWCEFFRQNHFYVGLSIDGPQELHDRFRVGKGGTPWGSGVRPRFSCFTLQLPGDLLWLGHGETFVD
jgi:uncharacterized protein